MRTSIHRATYAPARAGAAKADRASSAVRCAADAPSACRVSIAAGRAAGRFAGFRASSACTPRERTSGKLGGGRIDGSHAGRVAASADKWRTMLGASPAFQALLTEGMLDFATKTVWSLPPMGAVPLSGEDLVFGTADLTAGREAGVYEVVHEEEVVDFIRRGHLVSSAFTIWQGEGEDLKGRFVVNFSRQSKMWERGPVKMESMEECASEIRD